jgi:hypothetical protein
LRLPGKIIPRGALAAGAHQQPARPHPAFEIRPRSPAVGAFPNRQSGLNLDAARFRYIARSEWSTKKYLCMELLKDQQMSAITT